MTAPAKRIRVVSDVSRLPNLTFGVKSTTWWGTLGFMVAEGMTLVICAMSYLYLRKNFYTFPPEGTPLPGLAVPIVQLVLMGVSIVPMAFAARSARALDIAGARNWLTVELVLKIAILVMRWYEFKALNVWWNTNAYGSAAWITMGFHTTMLILDAAEDGGFVVLLWSPAARVRLMTDVVDDAIYWYFTVIAWVPLFALLFLYPRWL